MISFGGFVAWCTTIWTWWRGFWLGVWQVLCKSVIAQMALVGSFVAGIIKLCSWIMGKINEVMSLMQGVRNSMNSVDSGTPSFIEYFQIANMFIPITDWLAVLVIASTVAGAIGLYRFVKSWIPTVSGS